MMGGATESLDYDEGLYWGVGGFGGLERMRGGGCRVVWWGEGASEGMGSRGYTAVVVCFKEQHVAKKQAGRACLCGNNNLKRRRFQLRSF